MGIAVFGDVHWKREEPYYTGLCTLFDFIVKEHKDDTVVFTGDLYDASNPHWDLVKIVREYLLPIKRVIVIHGNHEFSRIRGSALKSLLKYPNIEVYTEYTKLDIDGYDFRLFPFRYNPEEIQAYAEITDECDFAVTHITPVKHQFHTEGVDLNIRAKHAILHGHTHAVDEWNDKNGIKNLLVGVPQTTRNGEQAYHKRMIFIDTTGSLGVPYTSIPVPVTMEIEEVKYGDTPIRKTNLLNIIDAPSTAAAEEEYKDYHIRTAGIKVLRTIEDGDDSEGDLNDFSVDLKKKYVTWAKKNKVATEIIQINVEYLEKIGA